jgi:DNA sulfur modification protein DndE
MMDALRVNKTAKDQLATLKRRTGIAHYNVLCRWALCRSLSEATSPLPIEPGSEGGVDIKWETFAGEQSAVLLALVKHRCVRDGLPVDDDSLAMQIRLHVHRGIGYLFGDRRVSSLAGLIAVAHSK